jgi:hypothetical protein
MDHSGILAAILAVSLFITTSVVLVYPDNPDILLFFRLHVYAVTGIISYLWWRDAWVTPDGTRI